MSTAVQSISHFPLFGASKRSHDDAFFKEPTHSWNPPVRRDTGLSVTSLTTVSPKVVAATISAMKPETREDDVTLPPLREAIPEFQAHNPQDKVGEKPSPTCPGEGFVPQMQTETEGPCDSLPVSIPSPKRRRMSQKEPFKYQPFSPPESVHRPNSTRATNSAEPELPRYSHHGMGGSPLSRARALHRPTTSLTDVPRSSGLPPFSFHSSRGSSSDVDSERPPLPTLFVGTNHPPAPRDRYVDSPVSSDMSPSYSSYRHSPPMRRGSPVGRSTTSYPMGYAPAPPFVGRGLDKPMFGGAHRHDIGVDYYEPGAANKRRRGNLPKHVTELLRAWLHDHLDHPYPTEDEKQMLMAQTGLSISQISNWFINARRRRVPGITNARQSLDGGKNSQNRRSTSD